MGGGHILVRKINFPSRKEVSLYLYVHSFCRGHGIQLVPTFLNQFILSIFVSLGLLVVIEAGKQVLKMKEMFDNRQEEQDQV